MSENLIIALVTSGAGVLGLVGGYFFREYQNRAKNFIYVYSLSSTTKKSDLIEINDTILNQVNSGSLFNEFKTKTQFKIVDENWDYCDDLKVLWRNMENIINKIIESSDEKEVIDFTGDLFELNKFDYWILRFLARNKADDLKNSKKINDSIKLIEPDEDGDSWIEFPKKNVSFFCSNNTALRSKADILLNNVKHKNITNIKIMLERFKGFMNIDYDISVQVINELKELSNKQSRWTFYLQISNISKYPIIFGLNPLIKIYHGKNTYVINLYTALLSEDDVIVDTERPVFVNNNETRDIVLITKEIEKDFDNSNIIRDIFEKNLGEFQIEWNVIRPGLFQKQKIISNKQDFNINDFA